MIIVDFIDMESRANQLTVLQTFENELAPDKAKPQIGQLSDLGLVEMTRHRQGQSLSEIFTRRCNTCSGTGHALEEFSWMHTGGDGDSRGRQSRNKLPVRQPNRLQQVPKPAASVHQKKDKARVALGNLAEAAGQKKDAQSAQSNITPGNILLNNLASKKQGGADSQETLTEYFSERTFKLTGVRLSLVTKLSHMPMAINSVLTRINPKANDIVTLVHSIEAAANMPVPMQTDELIEGEFDEDGADEEEAEIPAEPELVAVSAKARPARGGRTAADDALMSQESAIDTNDELPEIAVFEVELPDQADYSRSDFIDEAAEEIDADEEELEADEPKPRRGRATKRQEESVDDLEVLQSDEEDEDDADELLDVIVDEDEIDEMDSGDDEELEGEEAGSSVAVAKGSQTAAAAAKRRKGRPAKRSIKKPPTKR
jgi:hypothetical protein